MKNGLINSPEKFESELKRFKFLDYYTWAEIKLLEKEEDKEFCYRCNKPLEPLTWLEPGFFMLPCWDCIGRRKTEREILVENIIRNIREFYMNRVGDRYFQLYIIDGIYFKNTLPHNYTEFKKVINSLNPPSRNDIWFLDWVPGYPKVISQKNIDGIKIVNLSSRYKNIELGKTKIVVEDYEIIMPEEVKPDTKHRTRYGIFSKGNDNRNSKRIKIGDKTYKLFNTDNPKVKSLFKILKNGEEVALRSLPYQDYVILKLALMRDRTFLKFVFDLLTELSKQVKYYRDAVFLKNTILIDPKKDSKINFIWNSISDEIIDDFTNISLL